jgi:C_GCAxxG_C_C family probable redox protein
MLSAQEAQGIEDERMVKLTSGLPGGIGLLRSECGCLTCPIMVLGLEYGADAYGGQIPKVIPMGQRYMNRFRDQFGGIHCKEVVKIDITDRDVVKEKGIRILGCFRVMVRSPGLLMDIMKEDAEIVPSDINGDTASAYVRLLKAFQESNFHCTHSVLHDLDDVIDVDEDLLRASWGFVGGTLLQGLTCGALTAGVLVIGSVFGEIEDSYVRALKLIHQAFVDGDIMRGDLNKYNRAINISHELTRWFEEEFGSTRCGDILGLDFSTPENVDKYISENGIDRCREITRRVAQMVRKEIREHQ